MRKTVILCVLLVPAFAGRAAACQLEYDPVIGWNYDCSGPFGRPAPAPAPAAAGPAAPECGAAIQDCPYQNMRPVWDGGRSQTVGDALSLGAATGGVAFAAATGGWGALGVAAMAFGAAVANAFGNGGATDSPAPGEGGVGD